MTPQVVIGRCWTWRTRGSSRYPTTSLRSMQTKNSSPCTGDLIRGARGPFGSRWRAVLWSYSFDYESPALFVCNPVLRTVKQLPHVAASRPHFSIIAVMSTDRVSMEYEVFVIYRVRYGGQPDVILIYTSKTGGWRTASTIPPPRNLNVDYERQRRYIWYSMDTIFVKNELYILFGCNKTDPLHAGMFSFDKVGGVVSEVGVEVPRGHADHLQLIESKDRLFCAVSKREFETSNDRCIEIFEIILPRKECIWVTEMRSELVKWVLGHDLNDNSDMDDVLIGFDDSDPIVATGSADSILVCSFTGRSVAYSLSNKSWHCFPDNKLLKASKFVGAEYELFGSNYCLSLCAP